MKNYRELQQRIDASNNARVDSYYWQVQDYIDALESKEQQQEEESKQ